MDLNVRSPANNARWHPDFGILSSENAPAENPPGVKKKLGGGFIKITLKQRAGSAFSFCAGSLALKKNRGRAGES
jgi:hypothetical protein